MALIGFQELEELGGKIPGNSADFLQVVVQLGEGVVAVGPGAEDDVEVKLQELILVAQRFLVEGRVHPLFQQCRGEIVITGEDVLVALHTGHREAGTDSCPAKTEEHVQLKGGHRIKLLGLDVSAHLDNIIMLDCPERPILPVEGHPVDGIQEKADLLLVTLELQGRRGPADVEFLEKWRNEAILRSKVDFEMKCWAQKDSRFGRGDWTA